MSDFKWRHFSGDIILLAVRWYWKPGWSSSLKVDETYIRVKGKWMYLYRAITKKGETVDFYLSATRNQKAAKRFLGKALNSMKPYKHPNTLNTDKDKAYGPAIKTLKEEDICAESLNHRQVKYLNNRIESDHGKLKRLIKPVLGFQSKRTAYATIKGFEVMRMFRKGQMDLWCYGQGIAGEVRLVQSQFVF